MEKYATILRATLRGLIGTSRQTGPGAYNNLEMLLSYGYSRHIYLVHPKVPEILGYKTYPKVAALPEIPDLAVISLGRERVLDTAESAPGTVLSGWW
jgi:acetyltransferase